MLIPARRSAIDRFMSSRFNGVWSSFTRAIFVMTYEFAAMPVTLTIVNRTVMKFCHGLSNISGRRTLVEFVKFVI